MAAFVDYTTRDRGVLGYRGFEQALMNDPNLRKIGNILQEIADRVLDKSIDRNQLEASIREGNDFKVSSILGYTKEELRTKMNSFSLSANRLKNKYPQIINRNSFSSLMNNKNERTVLSFNKIRNPNNYGGEQPSKPKNLFLACPQGQSPAIFNYINNNPCIYGTLASLCTLAAAGVDVGTGGIAAFVGLGLGYIGCLDWAADKAHSENIVNVSCYPGGGYHEIHSTNCFDIRPNPYPNLFSSQSVPINFNLP